MDGRCASPRHLPRSAATSTMRARSAMIRFSAKSRRVDFGKTCILQRAGIGGGMMPPDHDRHTGCAIFL